MMWLRRRRLLLVGLAAVVLLGCGLFAWLQLPRPGVTRANYERIQEGMTPEEVKAILGGWGEDGRVALGPWPREDDARLWGEGDLLIWAHFHRGRLDYRFAETIDPPLKRPNLLDRLRRLLRL
jgi:hypothetical protein